MKSADENIEHYYTPKIQLPAEKCKRINKKNKNKLPAYKAEYGGYVCIYKYLLRE